MFRSPLGAEVLPGHRHLLRRDVEGEGEQRSFVFTSTPMADLTDDGLDETMTGFEQAELGRGDGQSPA